MANNDLKEQYPVFEFLPFETLISKTQTEYYKVLSICDKAGNSTLFIEYMLQVINKSLEELLNFKNRIFSQLDRIEYFIKFSSDKFSRKDYMNVFKDISSATATRDLRKAEDLKLIAREGQQNRTIYKIL